MENKEDSNQQPDVEENKDQQNPAPQKTQEELDELHKQITLNNEYQNKLKQEICEQMPFISELHNSDIVLTEYMDTKFEQSVRVLIKDKADGGRGYKHIRRLRRDGNCFYRAFLYQLFEHYAIALQKGECQEQYKKLIDTVEKSKDDLVKNAGYDEIVIEDFYDCFLGAVKKLEELPKQFGEQKDVEKYEDFVS